MNTVQTKLLGRNDRIRASAIKGISTADQPILFEDFDCMDDKVGFCNADNCPWIAFECIEKSLPNLFRYG